jgi:hypothetical protein
MYVIDNTNLLNMCRDCGAVGFIPVASYVYDAEAETVTVENASTIPAGDVLKQVKVKIHDYYGGTKTGVLYGKGGGGYTSAPTVVFSGGGGTGAAGTAVLQNGRVISVTITDPGSSYETAPTVAFTGGGGSGAVGEVVLDADTVGEVNILDNTDDDVAIDVSDLDRSKALAVSVTIMTDAGITADGGAYGLLAAGDIGHWDVKKTAAV